MSESNPGVPPVTEKPSIEITPGMQALLSDGPLCKRVAECSEDFEKLLSQLQRDSSSEANMATAGPMLVALRKVGDLMLLVTARGAAQAQVDERNLKTKTP